MKQSTKWSVCQGKYLVPFRHSHIQNSLGSTRQNLLSGHEQSSFGFFPRIWGRSNWTWHKMNAKQLFHNLHAVNDSDFHHQNSQKQQTHTSLFFLLFAAILFRE